MLWTQPLRGDLLGITACGVEPGARVPAEWRCLPVRYRQECRGWVGAGRVLLLR